MLILVSLVTRPEDPNRIATFFERLRRSSDDEALLPDGTHQPASERGEELLLVDLPGWLTRKRWTGFFARYREDLVGFALGWATVAFLVFTAWLAVNLGR